MPIAVSKILICTVDVSPCPPGNIGTASAVVIPPEYAPLLGVLLDNGGLDWPTVSWVFGTGLFIFAIGAGIGMVISAVRRARL